MWRTGKFVDDGNPFSETNWGRETKFFVPSINKLQDAAWAEILDGSRAFLNKKRTSSSAPSHGSSQHEDYDSDDEGPNLLSDPIEPMDD